MIEHEMLFLGLLVDGPKHGYEIKRKIQEELYPFVGLNVKSIYYPLKKMEELKLVRKDAGREGRFPEKFVYSITPQGRKVFDQLIAESFVLVERPYFNIDLSLYFLPYIDKKVAYKKLRGRMIFLNRIQRQLLSHLKDKKAASLPKHLTIIFEHDFDLIEAEIKSLKRLLSTLRE